MITASVIALLGTFAFASICAFAIFQFLAGPVTTRGARIRIAVMSLGLGPLLLGYLLTGYLTLFPGGTHESAIVAVMLSLLTLAALARARNPQRRELWRDGGLALGHLVLLRRFNPVSMVGVLVLLFISGALFVVTMVVPLSDNDALEYAGSAKLVFEEMSARRYPFVNLTDADDYYGPWSHPMGYVALQTWGFLLQGHTEDGMVIRFITPWFAISTALLVIHAVGGIRRTLAGWAAVLLLATPAYLFTTMQSHIDQIRIFSLVAAVLCVPLVCHQPDLRRVLGLGCVLGAGIFAHSLGLLSCLLISALMFLGLPGGFWRRTAVAASVSLVAVLLVAWRLFDNIMIFGSPIADVGAVPVYALPELAWDAYFREARGIATFADQWLAGFLAGLTQPRIYGITYWLFVIALFFRGLAQREGGIGGIGGIRRFDGTWLTRVQKLSSSTSTAWLCLLVVLMFYGMVFVSVALDMDAFIKNYRYMMTTLPLLVIFIARSLEQPVDQWLAFTRLQGRVR